MMKEFQENFINSESFMIPSLSICETILENILSTVTLGGISNDGNVRREKENPTTIGTHIFQMMLLYLRGRQVCTV